MPDLLTDLLTDREVAEILRRSTETVKRLRLSGQLPYIPGRPPMIARADLEAYIERAKVRGPHPPPAPVKAAETEVSARAWALAVKTTRQRRKK